MNDDFSLPDFGLDGVDIDFAAFDQATTKTPSALSQNRYVKPKAFKPVRQVKYDRAIDLVRDMLPSMRAGERIDALLSGNFIFGDLFEAFSTETNAQIDDLTLSTLSFGKDNVDSLKNMMQGGYLINLNIVVSDYFWSHHRINAPYIFQSLDIDDRFQLAVAGTHTKIALMNIGGHKLVIHGSANLRSSRSLEAITIETSADLYDFHKSWHDLILTRYATIKKPLRASKLFDHITKNAVGDKWDE